MPTRPQSWWASSASAITGSRQTTAQRCSSVRYTETSGENGVGALAGVLGASILFKHHGDSLPLPAPGKAQAELLHDGDEGLKEGICIIRPEALGKEDRSGLRSAVRPIAARSWWRRYSETIRAVAGGVIYVGTDESRIIALDTNGGSELRQVAFEKEHVLLTPVVTADLVPALAQPHPTVSPQGTLHAHDANADRTRGLR